MASPSGDGRRLGGRRHPGAGGRTKFSLRLFASFSLIALAFVASSAYANWLSVEIEQGEHARPRANALPSVEHLTAAVDALRDLEASTDDYADLPADQLPAARTHIAATWKVVDAQWSVLVLPAFPGERDLYAEVPGSLRDLDAAMERLFVDTESGDRGFARVTADCDVRGKANRAARLLRHLVRFNADHATESSTPS